MIPDISIIETIMFHLLAIGERLSITWKSAGGPTYKPLRTIIFFYCMVIYSMLCMAHSLGQRYDRLHRRSHVWTDAGLARGTEKRAFSACFEGFRHHRLVCPRHGSHSRCGMTTVSHCGLNKAMSAGMVAS